MVDLPSFEDFSLYCWSNWHCNFGSGREMLLLEMLLFVLKPLGHQSQEGLNGKLSIICGLLRKYVHKIPGSTSMEPSQA